MEKGCVIAEMHSMVVTRLFGSSVWLADREVVQAVTKKLDDLGLQETVSDKIKRPTHLGKELNLDLIMVFVGVFDELDVPMILEEYGLLDEIEMDEIYEGPDLSEHGERILRPIVQKAFLDHYNPSGRLA